MVRITLNILSKMEGSAIAILFTFNLLILFVTVIMRYFFNNPPCWPEEASRYVMIWIVYLGATQSIEKYAEIKIDVLPKLIQSPVVDLILSVFASIVGLLVSILIAYYGIQFVIILIDTNQIAASFAIPMSIIYIIIPLSGILMGLKYIINIYKTFTKSE
jgi:C4-dicarboxylate transporter DctQ subunit